MKIPAIAEAAVTVLYVEDDPETREIVKMMISRKFPDIELLTAEDGKAGLELFEKHQPDIVLTDLDMPALDGLAMTRHIRAMIPEVYLILITACNETHHLKEAIKLGVKHYVVKPVEHALLFEAIEDGIAHTTLERKLREQGKYIRKLSRAVEQSPNTVIITDSAGVIEYVNPRLTELTGYLADEVVGGNPRIFQSGTTAPEIYRDLWDTINSGRDWHGEFHNRKKNGELYWESAAISPVFDKSCAITHFVAVKEDISNRKRSEQEFEALNVRLAARSEELESANVALMRRSADLQKTTEKLRERNTELESLKLVLERQSELLEERIKERTAALSEEITVRNCTEEALRNSEAHLRVQFECMPVGCIVWDSCLRAISCNPAAESLLGYQSEEMVGRGPFFLLAQQTAWSQVDAVRSRLFGGEDAVREELETVTKDGRQLACIWSNTLLREVDGTVAGVLSMVWDVSDHKRAHKALRESEARYRTLVDNVSLGIMLIDDSRRVITTNLGICRMLQKSMDEITLKKCFQVFKNKAAPCENCPGTIALESGEPAVVEGMALRDDGSGFPARFHAFPVFNAGGKATHFIKVVEDITEQKQAEEEQHRLEQRLRHSQKMEALGTFVGGIAHDFNNILTAIIGYGTLLEREIPPDGPGSRYLDRLNESSERAAELTRSLLAYSRRQPVELQAVDISALVLNVRDFLSKLLCHGINLVINAEGGPMPVMADQLQIEQILMNLTANARDAMPGGGILQISAERVDLDRAAVRLLGMDRPGSYACIEVSDSGCGMDDQTKERIFEPFFTTKSVGKGTGLGLSIVFGIVKQHRGHIRVSSEPDKGTTFSIYLPLAYREAIVPGKEPPLKEKAVPATILLLENDPRIRSTWKKFLKGKGFTVIEAKDGADGVKEFQKYKGEIDLLLFEVTMPKVDNAYEEIKRICPEIRSIVMTGYPVAEISQDMMHDGKVDFISKPFTMDDLLIKVQRVHPVRQQ